MQITINSQTETEANLTITLEADDLKEVKAHVFDELRPSVKAPGFRPGKAPDAIVERQLGSAHVQSEFIEHAINDTYIKAVREKDLAAISSPQVNLEKFVPYTELVYRAIFELLPPVKLPNYQDYRFKQAEVKVEPNDVDRTIDDLRRLVATRQPAARPVQSGDEVNLDFAGSRDGEPVPGATTTGYTLRVGSGNFIPGFEDQLIGLESGQEKTFDIRFPKEYHELSLADQIVQFKVKINTITELVLPEANDELATKVSPFKTLEELRQDIVRAVTDEKSQETSRQLEQEIMDKLMKDTKVQLPANLLQQQTQNLKAEREQELQSRGQTWDDYLKQTSKTPEQLDKDLQADAERRLTLAIMLTQVAKQENITVSPEDVDAELERLKQLYPQSRVQQEMSDPGVREDIYNRLMSTRVMEQLRSYAASDKPSTKK